MPTVTALRARGTRVAVELDGRPWRTLSVASVAEAGLIVGRPLEREHVRDLARTLRRERAAAVAVSALARRERSRADLDARLARAGVRDVERRETVERAARAGLVDDARFAAAPGTRSCWPTSRTTESTTPSPARRSRSSSRSPSVPHGSFGRAAAAPGRCATSQLVDSARRASTT
jgi:hypothetical protein